MIDLEELLKYSEETKKYLKLREIKEEKIEEIRKKLTKRKETIKNINTLRQNLNQKNILKHEENNLEKETKKKLKKLETKFENNEKIISEEVSKFPNIPISEEEKNKFNENLKNVVIIEKNFQEPLKSFCSETIFKKTKIISEVEAISLSGSKFVVYKDYGSDLLHALMNFMLHENKKKGYRLLILPYITDEENLYNTGQLPKFRDDLYKIEGTNKFLIPTSEVTLINFHKKKIFNEKDLPLYLTSFSPCFRKEAGKSGKENKGLIRLHQFNKVELVKIVKPENSFEELDLMVKDVCDLLNKLKISYRVIDLNFKEISFSSIKTYDVEIWLPGEKRWLEISSCSNCSDFQSRRAKIKFKRNKKNIFAHTLNGSSLAIDRLILAICEYYYDAETNKINVPKILEKFFL